MKMLTVKKVMAEMGRKGGAARKANLSPEELSAQGRKAAAASARVRSAKANAQAPTPKDQPEQMQVPEALWNLRVVAHQWLLEHPDNPEAPAIRKALERTKDLV